MKLVSKRLALFFILFSFVFGSVTLTSLPQVEAGISASSGGSDPEGGPSGPGGGEPGGPNDPSVGEPVGPDTSVGGFGIGSDPGNLTGPSGRGSAPNAGLGPDAVSGISGVAATSDVSQVDDISAAISDITDPASLGPSSVTGIEGVQATANPQGINETPGETVGDILGIPKSVATFFGLNKPVSVVVVDTVLGLMFTPAMSIARFGVNVAYHFGLRGDITSAAPGRIASDEVGVDTVAERSFSANPATGQVEEVDRDTGVFSGRSETGTPPSAEEGEPPDPQAPIDFDGSESDDTGSTPSDPSETQSPGTGVGNDISDGPSDPVSPAGPADQSGGPEGGGGGDDHRVFRLNDDINPQVFAKAHPDGLKIARPTNGERLNRGRTVGISWRVTEIPAAHISIYLIKNADTLYQIADETLDDGTLDWIVGRTVDSTVEVPNGLYFMSACHANICVLGPVISIENPQNVLVADPDQSTIVNQLLTQSLSPDALTFVRPRDGEILVRGETVNVLWVTSGLNQRINIDLIESEERDGGRWRIARRIFDDGALSWRVGFIPGGIGGRSLPTGRYQVEVCIDDGPCRTGPYVFIADTRDITGVEPREDLPQAAIAAIVDGEQVRNRATVRRGSQALIVWEGVDSNACSVSAFENGGSVVYNWDQGSSVRTTTIKGQKYGGRISESASYSIACENKKGQRSTATLILETDLPSVDLKLNREDGPLTMKRGTRGTLTWTSRNAIACAISATEDGVQKPRFYSGGAPQNTGGIQTSPIVQSATYSIVCENRAGEQAFDDVLVNAVGEDVEAPIARLTVNGSASATVFAGDRPRYEWSSENADTFVSRFSTTDSSCTADGSTVGDWIARSASGASDTNAIADYQRDCTYTITYRASRLEGDIQLFDSSTITVTVAKERRPTPPTTPPAPSPLDPAPEETAPRIVDPAAILKANNSDFITVRPGDQISYFWIGQGGLSYGSRWSSIGPSTCAGEGEWTARTASGQTTGTILASQAGCTYTIAYFVYGNADRTNVVAAGDVTIIVEASPPTASAPSALLTANGTDYLNTLPGDQITYRWSAEGGASYGSRWSSIGPSTCAGEGEWVARSASGTDTATVGSHQAGCTYTIGYFVYGNADRTNGVAFDDVTVVVGGLGDPGTETTPPPAEPTPEPTPFINITSCANSSSGGCASSNRVIFPVRNGAGAFNRYPVYCAGSYSINTAGTSWSSSCSTGFQTLTNCQTPDGRSISSCPASPPTSKSSVSCVNKVCTGYNSRVFPVENGNGQKNTDPYACDGSWQINTSGSNFTSSCADSKGWYRVASGNSTATLASVLRAFGASFIGFVKGN